MATDVSRNLDAIYARKRAAVFALCLHYAALVLAEFREQQMVGPGGGSWIDRYNGRGKGRYWNNQTETAAREVFSDAFSDGDDIGFFIAHMVEYGVYLELANDRRHEALRPLIEKYYPRFRKDVEAIYADAA
ncbi:MAG: hypothetical protein PHS14_07985 [Elusimicrobia bacterium]|nr:hypothetical protein [Elusimicrobiota bacterium]